MSNASETRHIGILLFPDVEELDAVGPWEVLAYWTRNHPHDGYAVTSLSQAGGLVQCAKGLVVQAHHSYADAPPLEVLVYPGGRGTRDRSCATTRSWTGSDAGAPRFRS